MPAGENQIIEIAANYYGLSIKVYREHGGNKKTAMYGVWGIIVKHRIRKLVAEILDIMEAPYDIKV